MMWNCRIIVWLIVVNYYWFRIELWLVRMLVINDRFLGWLVLGIRHWPSGGRLVAGTMVMVRRRRLLRVGLRHLLRLIGGGILGDRFTRHVTGHFMLLIVLIFIFIYGRLWGGRERVEVRIFVWLVVQKVVGK